MTDIQPTPDQLAWARETYAAMISDDRKVGFSLTIARRLAEREAGRGANEEWAKTTTPNLWVHLPTGIKYFDISETIPTAREGALEKAAAWHESEATKLEALARDPEFASESVETEYQVLAAQHREYAAAIRALSSPAKEW